MGKKSVFSSGEEFNNNDEFLKNAPDAPIEKKVYPTAKSKEPRKPTTCYLHYDLWLWAKERSVEGDSVQVTINKALKDYVEKENRQ